MSEKEVLSRDQNNIPFEGGLAAFPPASHQEVGVGSAQTENRGDREEPEPNFIQKPFSLPPDSPHSNTDSPFNFLDHNEIEGDEELDIEKSPLPSSGDAETTLSKLVTGSNRNFGLSSDCHEWTQVEPMVFVPSFGNKVFQKQVLLHEY
ncbi:uncharacterized protein LOC135348372 [Halichondria panicea]|uniref:uncharacterized protein LOC135348372 n=1 Tax=Halichondria panicea TaxID=6063 RepID=UPI00312B6C28